MIGLPNVAKRRPPERGPMSLMPPPSVARCRSLFSRAWPAAARVGFYLRCRSIVTTERGRPIGTHIVLWIGVYLRLLDDTIPLVLFHEK